MPLRLLGNRNLQVAMLLTAIFMSSYGVQYYFLAIYFQSVYGYSVLQTGLAFLPATLLCTLGIRVAERLLASTGPSPPRQRNAGRTWPQPSPPTCCAAWSARRPSASPASPCPPAACSIPKPAGSIRPRCARPWPPPPGSPC